jgi:polysaccharide pyruvyl transferase WcaK-like protein
LYRRLDVALTTRLHGAVFSAAAEIPFAAFSYLPKVGGFLRHVGMSDWTISMDEFQDARRLFDRVASLITRRHQVAAALRENVAVARARAHRHFDTIAELLAGREAA